MELFAVIASMLAVGVSVYTLKFQRRLEHETSSQTLIHDQYELCRVLDVLRVEHPEVSHMLALPAQSGDEPWVNYALFKSCVRVMLEKQGPIDEGTMARLYLQEHATALHVCDIYEQTLYQRELAEAARDRRRFHILDTLAQYYETRMLRNPRLRYHWDHGTSDMMEKSTRDRYDEKVRRAYPKDPIDATLPIQGPTTSALAAPAVVPTTLCVESTAPSLLHEESGGAA
jgi:hypothetical protein